MGVPTLTTSSPMPNLPPTATRNDWPTPLSSSQLTIFCDLDGPLIDVSQRYYKTYQLALAETQVHVQALGKPLALTPLSLAQFWRMKQAKRPDIEIAYLSGLTGEHLDFFLAQVQSLVNQPILLREDRLQPDVHFALEQLLVQGAQLAVVTLRCQEQVVQILQQYNLTHFFKFIRGTQDTQAAYKNYAVHKQALLREAMEAMGISSHQQMWMIGDTEADVLAAQAMKVKTIALTCGMRNYSFLEGLRPTSIKNNLTDATQFISKAAVVA